MGKDPSMKELQTQLNFDFGNGLSSSSQLATKAPIDNLLKGLERIYDRWGFRTPRQIKATPDIRVDSDNLFHELGPTLWPDVKKEDEYPDWLLENPKNLNGQYLTRFRYSDDYNRETFSEHFYKWVCLRISNRRRPRKSKKKAFVSDAHPDPEYSGTPETGEGEVSTRNNSYFEGDDSTGSRYSSHLPPDHRINNSQSRQSSHIGVLPGPASVAPTPAEWPSMGNTQATLGSAGHRHSGFDQHLEQIRRMASHPTSQPSGKGPTRSDSPAGLIEAFGSSDDREETPHLPYRDGHQMPPAKRSAATDTHMTGLKKYRFTPNVYNLKPRLVVKLKLTREQDARERTKTAPAQQSSVSSLPSESENIIVRPPAPPRRPDFLVADDSTVRQQDMYLHDTDGQRDTNGLTTSNSTVTNGTGGALFAQATPTPATVNDRDAEPTSQRPMANITGQDLETIARVRRRWPDVRNSDQDVLDALDKGDVGPLLPRAIQDEETPSASLATDRPTIAGKSVSQKESASMNSTMNHSDSGPPMQNMSAATAFADISSSGVATPKLGNRVKEKNLSDADTLQLGPRTTRGVSGDQEFTPGVKTTKEHFDQPTHGLMTKQSIGIGSVIPRAGAWADQVARGDLDILLRQIWMIFRVVREDGTKSPVIPATLEEIHRTEDFFQAAEELFRGELKPDEEIAEAVVKQVSGPPIDHIQDGFLVQRASRRNGSWTKWLADVQTIHDRSTRDFKMEMAADLVVKRKVDVRV